MTDTTISTELASYSDPVDSAARKAAQVDDLAVQLWQAWNRELSGVEPAAAAWAGVRIEYRRMWNEVARTALHVVSSAIAAAAGPVAGGHSR